MGIVYGNREQVTEIIAAAVALDANDGGKVFLLDAAAGAVVTLPALKKGLAFRFQVAAAFATTNWVIDSAEGDNTNGSISDMGATPAVVVASGEDQVNFVATAETIGDFVDYVADYDNSQWIVNGMCAANGGITATDPS
tara:strand:+ start:382 stop:798 length:417 start_codon:yes stop_codon:yes gene_type:complete